MGLDCNAGAYGFMRRLVITFAAVPFACLTTAPRRAVYHLGEVLLGVVVVQAVRAELEHEGEYCLASWPL